MRLIFLGTPELAVPSLEALVRAGHDVCRVVSQPDRPRDRGHRVQHTPVRAAAERLGLSVMQPAKVKDPALADELRELQADAFVLVAYGRIIPDALLDLAPSRWINMHPSLLPLYRGPAPIQGPLLHGDAITGVTTMLIGTELDAGDVLLQWETPIAADETAGTLHDRLAVLGADCLAETLAGIEAGTLTATPQDHTRATFTRKLTKTDGRLDFRDSAADLHNRIRAVTPWPGATAVLEGVDVKIFVTDVGDTSADATPGTVLDASSAGIGVATGDGSLRIRELQRSGKARMTAEAFLRGSAVAPGARFALPDGG